MENKIVVQLILKNLEEIKFLFETLLKEEKTDPLLIEIATLKAKTLYQELKLLLPKESTVETSDADLEIPEEPAAETSEELQLIQPEPETVHEIEEIQITEPSPVEEPFAEEESTASVETTEDSPQELLPFEEITVEEVATVVTEQQPEAVESVDEQPLPEEEEIVETPEEPAAEEEIMAVPDEELAEEPEVTAAEETVVETADTITESEPITAEETAKIIETVNEAIAEDKEALGILHDDNNTEQHEKKVFGEQFSKEPSLNDKLASANYHESKIKAQPIASIKGSIGLNDRFLFTRELFGNDSSNYESTIDQIDQFSTLLEAIEYLEKNFQWTKNNASLKFMELVKRRFDK